MANHYDDNVIWLALDVILFAVHDWQGNDEKLKASAQVFFDADPDESNYLLWLDVLKINLDDGIPTPEEISSMIKEAGYRNPLDARASKLHQLSKYPKPKTQ